jgi:hypothetical protein
MSNKTLALIIAVISIFIIARLFLLALKDPSQWNGFLVSSFHILLSGVASWFFLKKKPAKTNK